MDLINNLQQIGLSGREAEVYVALLQKNEFTAPELTKITTITRTKIYEILQNLIHKGACNESYRNGQKIFRAIEPRVALQNIISNFELEFELKKKTEIELKQRAALNLEKDLVSLHENNKNNFESLDYIEVLTDSGQIRERWLKIQKNTKKELLVFTKPPYLNSIESDVDDESKLLKNRKIVCKSLYEYCSITSNEEKDNLVKIIENFEKIGEQARIIKELPMKLVISDETVALLALSDRISLKPSNTTMIVDHPSFAMALKRVFESYWASAITIREFKKSYKI